MLRLKMIIEKNKKLNQPVIFKVWVDISNVC